MKNKINYILSFLLAAMAISACRDESKNPYPSISQGAIPVFTQNTDDSGIINYLSPDDTKLSFSVDKSGLAPVTNIDVILIYNNKVTNKSDTVVYQTVTVFPTSISIDKDQLLTAFPTGVLTIDTLSIGDSFVVGGNVLLKDGSYLDGGYSPSIFSKTPVNLLYSVGCPSNIPEGTYTASQHDEAGWFGLSSTAQVTITRVPNTVNQYLISDVSAGGYTAAYSSLGYHAQPAIISDVCNTISVTGAAGSQISSGQGLAPGSWDESTKTIVVHYDDVSNDSAGLGADLFSTFVKN